MHRAISRTVGKALDPEARLAEVEQRTEVSGRLQLEETPLRGREVSASAWRDRGDRGEEQEFVTKFYQVRTEVHREETMAVRAIIFARRQ